MLDERLGAGGRRSGHRPALANPYSAAEAFRRPRSNTSSASWTTGAFRYGYNQSGLWVDDILGVILGSRTYLVHTGDLVSCANLPTFERMFDYFVQRCRSDGLFVLPPGDAHWYYDEVVTSGVNAFYNAFIYKAAGDLAEMADATGDGAGADDTARWPRGSSRRSTGCCGGKTPPADRTTWTGSPRTARKRPISSICANGRRWPLASRRPSKQKDRRHRQRADGEAGGGVWLPRRGQHHHALADRRAGHGHLRQRAVEGLWGLSKWRPRPGHDLLGSDGPRRAGDAEGAWRRLRLFGRHAQQTSWAGDNAASIKGELKNCAGEPYLADMVVAPAALVHGILGIQPSWDRLEVRPCLPAAWPPPRAMCSTAGGATTSPSITAGWRSAAGTGVRLPAVLDDGLQPQKDSRRHGGDEERGVRRAL